MTSRWSGHKFHIQDQQQYDNTSLFLQIKRLGTRKLNQTFPLLFLFL